MDSYSTTYIIDFDSTLVTTESLDDLAEIALRGSENLSEISREIAAITDLGMTGQITFEEALARRLKLFSPTKDHIDELVVDLKNAISPSALRNKEWFLNNANNIYVVSGGFDDYIIPTVEALGLSADRVFANKFIYDGENVIDYDRKCPTANAGGKTAQVKQFNLKGEVVVIGDGYTDYEIRQNGAAHHFWAYVETVARPVVTEKADRIVKSFDIVSTY